MNSLPDTEPGAEHPFIGWLAVFAMLAAILCIVWVRVAIVGTRDVERTFSPDRNVSPDFVTQRPARHPHSLRKKAEDAAARSRWATGFSH